MYATRLFQLLILAVALVLVAQASSPDAVRAPRRGLEQRQNDDNTSNTDVPTSTDPAETTEEPASTTEPTTTEPNVSTEPTEPAEPTTSATSAPETTEEIPSSTQQQQESTSSPPQETTTAPTRTTDRPTDNATTSPPSETTTSSGDDGEDGSENDTRTTSLSRVVSTSLLVVTRTNEDGTRETFTTASTTTFTPGLNSGGEGQSQGMSAQTRDTIIGVVVGVGGAILLGALAIVWWRLRSRKRQAEENDGLMAYDDNTNLGNGIEKSERSGSPPGTVGSQSQRNPFQSTLENYHQPTPVNPSSNF